MGLKQRAAVKVVSVYVAMGFIATQLTFFFACRPFSGYWTLPPPQENCATYWNFAIVQGTFNISSDVFMLCIPLPMLITANFSPRQKIVLVGIFGLGIFVVRTIFYEPEARRHLIKFDFTDYCSYSDQNIHLSRRL
jgi:hypothetical protein